MRSYKTIFIVRFLGYFIFFTGLVSIIFVLGPLLQAELNYRVDRILGVKRVVKDISKTPNIEAGTPSLLPSASESSGFGNVKVADNNIITPVSTQYGIVIEKINANAKVIPNVNAAIEKEYVAALTEGVAEALGSTPPGQPGNLYLFSHSTDAPWNIIRYNAIFYLLRELTVGDRVVLFYHDKRYDYIVFDKSIASPNDVSYLTNRYDYPVLTLQTCDPPGTLLNRLIIRAKLVNS